MTTENIWLPSDNVPMQQPHMAVRMSSDNDWIFSVSNKHLNKWQPKTTLKNLVVTPKDWRQLRNFDHQVVNCTINDQKQSKVSIVMCLMTTKSDWKFQSSHAWWLPNLFRSPFDINGFVIIEPLSVAIQWPYVDDSWPIFP